MLITVVLHLDLCAETLLDLHDREVDLVHLELEVGFQDGADCVQADLPGRDIPCYYLTLDCFLLLGLLVVGRG